MQSISQKSGMIANSAEPPVPIRSKAADCLIKTAKIAAVVAIAAIAYLMAGWIGFFAVAGGALCYKLYTWVVAKKREESQESFSESVFTLKKALNTPVAPDTMHANKARVYKMFLAGHGGLPVEKEVRIQKIEGMRVPNQRFLYNMGPKIKVAENGPFSYPEGKDHWTANFGDQNLFFGWKEGLFAQDEHQTAMHPAIAHLAFAFTELSPLDKNGSAVLIEGLKRYGNIDTTKTIPRLGGTIYGNNFSRATTEELESVIELFQEPQDSNLFVFVAPVIPAHLEGQPYQKDHLNKAFSNAYAAFSSIVKKNPHAVIHTGNWGCGAFGGSHKAMALIQLLAARHAKVETLVYYAMGQTKAFKEAQQLFDNLVLREAESTPDQIITLLAGDPGFGLLYGRGNGT